MAAGQQKNSAAKRANRPWAEMLRGKPVTELWLSQQLRPYGIRTKTIWINGQSAKGYLKADFGDVFARYVPRNEAEEYAMS